jgi:hypothetical protein
LFLILFAFFLCFRHAHNNPEVVRENRPAYRQLPVLEAFG